MSQEKSQHSILESILSEIQQGESPYAQSNERDPAKSIKNITLTSLMGFSLYDLWLGATGISILEASLAALIFTLWLLSEKKRIQISTFSTLSLLGVGTVLSYIFLGGENEHTGFLWLFVFPLLAVLFKGLPGLLGSPYFYLSSACSYFGCNHSLLPCPMTTAH